MSLVDLFNRACRAGANTAGQNTQYSLYQTDDTLYLSIQGSCDVDDWIHNFMFWFTPLVWKPYKGMKHLWLVHAGFAKAWKLARDQIAKDVKDSIGNRKLVIMGFSHGAALAVLAHEYFDYEHYAPETHAFGCPRVVWGFPHSDVLYRFCNLHLYQARGDIVTHVPFALMGYRHVGEVRKFGPRRWITHLPHTLPNYRAVLA